MDRRAFLELLAAAPLASAVRAEDAVPVLPRRHPLRGGGVPGMPGPYPGKVVAVQPERCVDTTTNLATPRWCAR